MGEVRPTSEKWQGTVLQLHYNTIQDRQHRWDVKEEEDDGLVEEEFKNTQINAKKHLSKNNTFQVVMQITHKSCHYILESSLHAF